MELSRMLKFRNLWIGFAMLWIVFFHAGFWVESAVILTFKNIGYGGVDICLFASGIGCYFSLEKDPEVLGFLKRRIRRLGPAYFCFILPWLFWKRLRSGLPAGAILGNLLGIQSLVSWEYHFNWYIGGLVVYYLAMPYLKGITDSCGRLRQDVLAGLLLTAVGIPFWGTGTAVVILSRLPVLYAGLVCGKFAKRGYVLKKTDYWTAGVLAAAGTAGLLYALEAFPELLWNWGLYWYPFAMMVPGGCVFLSLLAEKLETVRSLRWINGFLNLVGMYSFELYLVHVFLYEGLMPDILARIPYVPNNLAWLATLPAVACGTYLLNRMAGLVSGSLRNKKA